jgi:hypothetical protein
VLLKEDLVLAGKLHMLEEKDSDSCQEANKYQSAKKLPHR